MTPAAPKAPTTPEPETQEEELPPILDLDTIAPPRGTILLRTKAGGGEKKAYELHRMGDYGIEEQHVIAQEQVEFDELWATPDKDLKADQRKRFKLLLDRLIVKALDAPKDVIEELDDEYRKMIVQAFTSRAAQNLQRALAQVLEQAIEEARAGSTSET